MKFDPEEYLSNVIASASGQNTKHPMPQYPLYQNTQLYTIIFLLLN